MAPLPPDPANTARYHAVKATQLWKDFIAGTSAAVTRSIDQRTRAANERKRETDYARGVLGGH
jgi:hypothetical protein